MPNENDKDNAPSIARMVTLLFGVPWLEITAEVWKITKKLWRGWANEGMYEVLDYNVTYELKDAKGKVAHISKQEKVRYLQNNIISYQDQAWGEGEILLNYQCSPGVKADEYQLGHKRLILISLRDKKQKGDMDEFNIEWDSQDAFLRPSEDCEVEISHRTKKLLIQVIFPKSRPPLKASVIEGTSRKTHILEQETIRKLPDGRWRIEWEKNHPRLYERYIVKWDW